MMGQLLDDKSVYSTLVKVFLVLGEAKKRLGLKALKDWKVIQGEKVDTERLEPATKSIFGEGAKVLLEQAMHSKATILD
jgi:hypothetical protein